MCQTGTGTVTDTVVKNGNTPVLVPALYQYRYDFDVPVPNRISAIAKQMTTTNVSE